MGEKGVALIAYKNPKGIWGSASLKARNQEKGAKERRLFSVWKESRSWEGEGGNEKINHGVLTSTRPMGIETGSDPIKGCSVKLKLTDTKP